MRDRYHRDDVDRVLGNLFVWGLVLYFICLAGYLFYWKPKVSQEMAAAKKELAAKKKKEKQKKSLEVEWRLLKEQLELSTTALNVLSATSFIPEGMQLNYLTFDEKSGQQNNITLRGEAGDRTKLMAYYEQLVNATVEVENFETKEKELKQLFDQVIPPSTDISAGGFLNWSIVCILRREEAQQ